MAKPAGDDKDSKKCPLVDPVHCDILWRERVKAEKMSSRYSWPHTWDFLVHEHHEMLRQLSKLPALDILAVPVGPVCTTTANAELPTLLPNCSGACKPPHEYKPAGYQSIAAILGRDDAGGRQKHFPETTAQEVGFRMNKDIGSKLVQLRTDAKPIGDILRTLQWPVEHEGIGGIGYEYGKFTGKALPPPPTDDSGKGHDECT